MQQITEYRVSYSLLHQLNNALCVHKEHFSLGLLVKSSSMAVQDVCNLETREINNVRYDPSGTDVPLVSLLLGVKFVIKTIIIRGVL